MDERDGKSLHLSPPPILQMCCGSETFRLVAQIRNNPVRTDQDHSGSGYTILEMKNYTLLNRIRRD